MKWKAIYIAQDTQYSVFYAIIGDCTPVDNVVSFTVNTVMLEEELHVQTC